MAIIKEFKKSPEQFPSVELVEGAFAGIIAGRECVEMKRILDEHGLAWLVYQVPKEAGADGYFEYTYERGNPGDETPPTIYVTDIDSTDIPGGSTVARYVDDEMRIL